jgi:myo-inositol-1(or 4)-monophosphatase
VSRQFPEDAIVGEELTNVPTGTGRPVWYVDPIDGTTNFVHGLKWCSFSLAVADSAGIALGVVADPWRRELFVAPRGQGARVNAAPMHYRDDVSLEGGLVLTELLGPGPWPGMTALLEDLGRSGCVARILGSSALSLANVAAGRAAGLVLGGAHPVDVAAGVVIAREAGAVVRVGAKAARALGPDELGAGAALVASAAGVVGLLFEALSRSSPTPPSNPAGPFAEDQ